MKKRRCKNQNCRCLFVISPRHPNQQYCSKKGCQRARKTKWHREKIAMDEDYKNNQADCQKRWVTKKPWYWKKYRERNPNYTKRNREKQKARDQSKRSKRGSKVDASILNNLAKMDASNGDNITKSGIYKLIPVNKNNLAKMDVVTVQIIEISEGYS